MIRDHLRQFLTLWRTTPDGFGGFIFTKPQIVPCRWEDKKEILPGSSTEVSRAIAYVDRDVSPEDIVYLGKSVLDDPSSLDTYTVREFSKIPDLRSLQTVRKCWLI